MSDFVSILMGVYNSEATLPDAIRSIQEQTFTNWELIICDDGSNDHSLEIAKQFSKEDSRIIVIHNEHNRGLSYSLNRCFKLAKGNYIARMDADDESVQERLKKEVYFLNSHPEYEIVGSAITYFYDDQVIRTKKYIHTPTITDIISGSPIAHATCMMRKSCLEQINGYNEDKSCFRVEDVDLWIRLYKAGFRCYNIGQPLYRCRMDYEFIRRQKLKYRINGVLVRLRGCREFHLPFKYYLTSFRPFLIGLVPPYIRYLFHRKR